MSIRLELISTPHVAAYCDCVLAVATDGGFLACPSTEQLERQARNSIAEGGVHLLAMDGPRVAGWGQVMRGQGDAVAHRADVLLGVRAEYRGQGLGSRLLGGCMNVAAARGVKYLELEVRSDNKPAIRLYHRAGFRATSTVRDAMRVDGVAYDAIRMILSLESR